MMIYIYYYCKSYDGYLFSSISFIVLMSEIKIYNNVSYYFFAGKVKISENIVSVSVYEIAVVETNSGVYHLKLLIHYLIHFTLFKNKKCNYAFPDVTCKSCISCLVCGCEK